MSNDAGDKRDVDIDIYHLEQGTLKYVKDFFLTLRLLNGVAAHKKSFKNNPSELSRTAKTTTFYIGVHPNKRNGKHVVTNDKVVATFVPLNEAEKKDNRIKKKGQDNRNYNDKKLLSKKI